MADWSGLASRGLAMDGERPVMEVELSVIVRDTGFETEDWHGDILDVPSGTDPAELGAAIGTAGMIRVEFPSFSDGRGFTIGRRLRLMGFRGRLRARGHVIADQYAMIRRVGFDEVEISDDLAARQPERQWLRRAGWRTNDYQSRLKNCA